VCLLLLLFLRAAVFYSGALLQVTGSCLDITLHYFPAPCCLWLLAMEVWLAQLRVLSV
jgi:hypothetical protein